MVNINKEFKLNLDQYYFFRKETYDESFIESFEKLSFGQKKLYRKLFNMINLHLKDYSILWSLFEFNEKSYDINNFKFYKSCFEVIMIDLILIYTRLYVNNLKILESEIYELLIFHLEKNLENETKIFSIIKGLDIDEILMSRIDPNLNVLSKLIDGNEEQMIDRTYFLFNQLLDPLESNELNELNYLDLKDLAKTDKSLDAIVFMFIPAFMQKIHLHILDKLEPHKLSVIL